MSEIFVIRQAHPADLPSLPDIERRASALFAGHDVEAGVLADVTSLADFERAEAEGLLWVAIARGNTPVGFAFAEMIDGNVHLDELDVVPEYGRRGIGAALVQEVCACAERRGANAVTLTTFRDIPWNAPFYATLGFEPLPESAWTPALARTVAKEAAGGLDPARRFLMRRQNTAARTGASVGSGDDRNVDGTERGK